MCGAKKIPQAGRSMATSHEINRKCRDDALGVTVKVKCGACDSAVATASLGIVSASCKEANAMMRGGELEFEVWNVGCGHGGAVHTRWIARTRKRNAKEGNEMATTHRFARKSDPGGKAEKYRLLGASLARWRYSAMEKLVRRACRVCLVAGVTGGGSRGGAARS